MKIFVLNGPKTASAAFAVICTAIILYVGFFSRGESVAVSTEALDPCYVAVIVDDFGNGLDGTKEFLYLDIPFTGAVMPKMPFTAEESRLLKENGKDVILHMPMEPLKGDQSYLGDLVLTEDMTLEQINENIALSLKEVNYYVGINNHMGAKIMENEAVVTALLHAAKEEGLIFIDSKLTNKSKAKSIGDVLGVTVLERDVILDGTPDLKKIENNLKKVGEIARKDGFAIAIGHVGEDGGKVTAQALKNIQKEFAEQNIIFVTITDYLSLLK